MNKQGKTRTSRLPSEKLIRLTTSLVAKRVFLV